MHFKKQFIITLVTLFLFVTVNNAQVTTDQAVTPNKAKDDSELQRIERLTTYGPHYKNPKAAGRLLTLNRSLPDTVISFQPVQLFGPAYKHRAIIYSPADPASFSAFSKPKLMGPRYKNRGAKAH